MNAIRGIFAIGSAVTIGALVAGPASACTHAGSTAHLGSHSTTTHSGASYSGYTSAHAGYSTDDTTSHSTSYSGVRGTSYAGWHPGSVAPHATYPGAPTPTATHYPCPTHHQGGGQYPGTPGTGTPTPGTGTTTPGTGTPGTDTPTPGTGTTTPSAGTPGTDTTTPAPAVPVAAPDQLPEVQPAAVGTPDTAVLSTGSTKTLKDSTRVAARSTAAPTVIDAGEERAAASQVVSSPWGDGLIAFGAALLLGGAAVARRRA